MTLETLFTMRKLRRLEWTYAEIAKFVGLPVHEVRVWIGGGA